ncbi:MAG: hypothetical protein AB7M12_10145 [Hyphomonadaceae bacterium]
MASRTFTFWAAGITLAAPAAAFAAPLALSASDQAGGGARIEAHWLDGRPAPAARTRVEGGVLIVTFDEAFEADLASLAAGAPKSIAFARRDADGRTLRVALRNASSVSVSASGASRIIALAPAPKPQAAQAAAKPDDPGRVLNIVPERPVDDPLTSSTAILDVGERPDFTRLSFLFPRGATLVPLLTGDQLQLKFSKAADIDISDLRIEPPKYLVDARKVSKPGAPLQLLLTLAPGVRQRHFVDGPRVVVDLLPPVETKPPPAPSALAPPMIAKAAPAAPEPQAALADPTPKSGVVRVQAAEGAQATTFTVRWANPARAAAFRRGEAIWLVFDAQARLDISGIPLVGRRHTNLQQVAGDHVVALRIAAPPEILVTARADGDAWTFLLSERAPGLTATAAVTREADAKGGGAKLVVDFGRDGAVRWINDPEIGDRFAAALLPGPIEGVDVRRATMEAAILPAAQGAAVEPRADGVGAEFQDGKLIVTRGVGLIASAQGGPTDAEMNFDPAAPVLLDLAEWGGSSKSRAVDVLARLQSTAANEGFDAAAKADARMALARFLLAHELAAETLGALRIAAINQPQLEEDASFRLMRGAANLMLRRVRDAQGDLASGKLADDASASLWRGYAAALQENWQEARRGFELGRSALYSQPPAWRVRFNLALGESALELNDFAAAESAIAAATGEAQSEESRANAKLLAGRLAYARGDEKTALALFDEVAQSREEEPAVKAILAGVRLRREQNLMSPADAAEMLEALRFRWRGDATELEIIQALGHVYEDMSRWREALSVMHAASARFPDLPAARRLRIDMASMFERLYLDGEADKLAPIQALGLFYEFKDLTPIGPNGDRMIRLLSARLVRVDLLEKAAELLQYQVDNRLDGVGQAQVAVDLATIYLANRQPEKAVMAIESTRQPGVPTMVAAERRLVESKALVDLSRFDHAMELLEKDSSPEAGNIRAEIAWRQKDWAQATALLLAVLQRRPDEALSEGDRAVVLRAAVAATLSDNKAALDKLKRAYMAKMAQTPDAASFEFICSGVEPGDYRLREIARQVARTDLIDKALGELRRRIAKEEAAPKT